MWLVSYLIWNSEESAAEGDNPSSFLFYIMGCTAREYDAMYGYSSATSNQVLQLVQSSKLDAFPMQKMMSSWYIIASCLRRLCNARAQIINLVAQAINTSRRDNLRAALVRNHGILFCRYVLRGVFNS